MSEQKHKHKHEDHEEHEEHHAKPSKMSAWEGFQYGFVTGAGIVIAVVLNWQHILAWIKEKVSQ